MAEQDVLMGYYEDFAKNDFVNMRTRFHNEITWNMPGHHPLSGKMVGKDAVIGFLQALHRSGIYVTDIHLGQLDNGTLVEKHMGHGKIGDEDFYFPTCTSYRFQDGLIAEVQVHTGDQHSVDRYMWTCFPLKTIPERLATE